MVRISGKAGSQDQSYAAEKSSSVKNDRFDELLQEMRKRGVKTGPGAAGRDRFRKLLEGGTKPGELVRVALQDHPSYQSLSPSLKEELVGKIADNLGPVLKPRV